MRAPSGHLFFHSEYAAIRITVSDTIYKSLWLYAYYESGLIFVQ